MGWPNSNSPVTAETREFVGHGDWGQGRPDVCVCVCVDETESRVDVETVDQK